VVVKTGANPPHALEGGSTFLLPLINLPGREHDIHDTDDGDRRLTSITSTMSAPPRRANGPRQYYSVPQSPASTSQYTQYTGYSQSQPQPNPNRQHRKTRRQIRRVPPPTTTASRSSHESRTHESRRGEMAHSVATGAIGGGYGPYSVSISSISDIICLLRSLTLIYPSSTTLGTMDRVRGASPPVRTRTHP